MTGDYDHGYADLSSRSRRSRSIPLMPGMRTSVTTQPTLICGSALRNADADS